ncbi:DUF2989 domain-containing protein [Flocculibacter collagenilyticus]|uniref:DUF2989 domain-containing protein n=1 Tax=Flocculibacter collagenilyticus TaxID=2744479 RepID=UPI0018F57362|nr:DUF2989 domain-containing protein [Flocculibacter collagenilyticus]
MLNKIILKLYIPYLFTFLLAIALTGCGDAEMTVRQACKDKPEICDDLNKDGHCNAERREVILYRHAERKLPTDKNKYNLLIALEDYSQCINLASKIEHKKLKEKTTSRVEGHLTSLREIKRVSRDTQTSELPELLYYHWSRNGDEEALEKFLALEEQGQLNTPELQFALATYWVKRDLNKTLRLLYNALALYEPEDEIEPEIFHALTTVYLKKRDYKKAYVWAQISKVFGDTNVEIEELRFILIEQKANLEGLDKLIEKTLEEIRSYSFESPYSKP